MTHHRGLDELREQWEATAQLQDRNRAERTVAYVAPTETFADSGRRALEVLIDALGPAVKAELTLLEFGCGLGRVTQHLDTLFKHVYAVDIAPTMVDAVASLGLRNTTTILDDGFGLDVKVPEVDAIYSDSVLLHNLKADVLSFWPRVTARLKPGGRAYFQLPCYETGGKEPGNWTDVGVWTEIELLRLAGLCDCVAEYVWVNPGSFSFAAIGTNHHRLHVFVKR